MGINSIFSLANEFGNLYHVFWNQWELISGLRKPIKSGAKFASLFSHACRDRIVHWRIDTFLYKCILRIVWVKKFDSYSFFVFHRRVERFPKKNNLFRFCTDMYMIFGGVPRCAGAQITPNVLCVVHPIFMWLRTKSLYHEYVVCICFFYKWNPDVCRSWGHRRCWPNDLFGGVPLDRKAVGSFDFMIF